MNIFHFFKKPINKIDDIREDVENLIAKGFRKIRDNEAVDKGEVAISNAIMLALEGYFKKEIPAEIKRKINEGVIIGCNNANIIIVDQLEKP